MKPRLLGLTLVAALVLAVLWILRTERARGPAAAASAGEPATAPPSVDLAPPPSGPARTKASASEAHVDPPIDDAGPATPAASGPSETSGSIRGFLLDTTGQAVPARKSGASASVFAYDELGSRHEGVIAGDTYGIDELGPSHYWVVAHLDRYRPARGEVEIALGEEAELDLVVEPAVVLEVRVTTPDGGPHPYVVAGRTELLVPVATHEAPGEWSFDVSGSLERPHGTGRFHASEERRAEGLLGDLELDGDLPIWVSLCLGQRVLGSELVSVGSETVVFAIGADGLEAELATLRVRAIDGATGELVPHVAVILRSSSMSIHPEPSESGITEFKDLSPGNYGITVTCEAYGLEVRNVLAEPGKLTEVDVELGASARIEGRVVDKTGRTVFPPNEDVRNSLDGVDALFGASVILGTLDPSTDQVCWDEHMYYGLDEEGRFSLSVGRDVHFLRVATSEWTSAAVRVDARQGSVEDVELVAHAPVSVVLRIESEALQGADFRVLEEAGIELQRGRFDALAPRRIWLAPGTYRLVVSDSGGATLFEASFVASGASVIVPVRL